MKFPWRKALVETVRKTSSPNDSAPGVQVSYDPFSYQRRAASALAVPGIEPGTEIKVGGEELVRVLVRQANYEKIAHKIANMGDYKPEVIYERAQIEEVDPRDDAAIEALNANADARLVTIKDDLDLPAIAAVRLLAARLEARHPIVLKDVWRDKKVPVSLRRSSWGRSTSALFFATA